MQQHDRSCRVKLGFKKTIDRLMAFEFLFQTMREYSSEFWVAESSRLCRMHFLT